MALCPATYENTNSVKYSQQNSFSRSSMSYRSQYTTNVPIDAVRGGAPCRISTRTTSCGGVEHPNNNVSSNGSTKIALLRSNTAAEYEIPDDNQIHKEHKHEENEFELHNFSLHNLRH